MDTHAISWTDQDGSHVLLTDDPRTCGDDGIAVVSIEPQIGGGAFITASQARDIIEFLTAALEREGGRDGER